MTCEGCEGLGLIPYLQHDFPKPEAEATFNDLHFAVCLCASGQTFRLASNNGRRVAAMWVLWCAKYQVPYERVAMVEDVFDAEDLHAAGLTTQPAVLNREAALLAASRKPKR